MLPTVVLVTSGLGTQYGGIGVVDQMIVSALETDQKVLVWHHQTSWPRPLRKAVLACQAAWGSLSRPKLVIYDHVHLAVLHALIPTLKRIPYVVFMHGIEVWLPLPQPRRQALVNADLLLTNSATTERHAREFNPWLPQVKTTWLGVRDQPQPVDAVKSPPIGLIVGRIVGEERCKGHDALMDAWPLIRAAVPNAQFVIVGTGDDENRLRRRVAQERLEGIEFRGRVSNEQRDEMYRSSRLLFFPSTGEGFGLAGVEAASFGLPVLALVGTVAEELFPDGGLILSKGLDKKSIAEAAIPVLADPKHAATLGQIAKARVQSTFLEDHFKVRFREAISPLLHNAKAPSQSRRSS